MMSNVQGQQYYSEQLFCHPFQFQMMPSSMFQSDDQKQDAIYIPESISPWSEIISKYLNGTAPSQRRHFKSRSKYHQSGHKCKSGNGLGMLTNGGPMHQFLHSRTSGGNNLSVHHSRVSAGHPMSFSPPPIRRTSSGVSKFSPSMGTSRMLASSEGLSTQRRTYSQFSPKDGGHSVSQCPISVSSPIPTSQVHSVSHNSAIRSSVTTQLPNKTEDLETMSEITDPNKYTTEYELILEAEENYQDLVRRERNQSSYLLEDVAGAPTSTQC